MIYFGRHKTNVNYGNLMPDELEKRVIKNLFCDRFFFFFFLVKINATFSVVDVS